MNRPLRVVAFTPGHQEVGGAARRSRLLCEELARRGCDVRVVTRSGSTRRFTRRRDDNLLVIEVPGCGGRLRGALTFLVVGAALGWWWGRRADVLLAVQLVSPTNVAALVGALRGLPFIALATTSGSLSEAAHFSGNAPSARGRRVLIRRAAGLVAQTPLGAAELRWLVPADRVRQLPTPVECVRQLPMTGAPSVLYAGRFSEEKDLLMLLSAWTDVVAERPDARLILAGAGGGHRSVEGQLRSAVAADPSLSATVQWPGWVTDVPSLLAKHDIYVFPSKSEGMSNSLVEACAAGRAVVASDIVPNVAVLGADYPLLFPVGDRRALAQLLLRVLADGELRLLAASATAGRARSMLLSEVGSELEGMLRHAADRARP